MFDPLMYLLENILLDSKIRIFVHHHIQPEKYICLLLKKNFTSKSQLHFTFWLFLCFRNLSVKLQNKTLKYHYFKMLTWFWMNIDIPFFPGSYNALSMANVRFFKPNPRTLVQLPDRLQGWRIRTGSYFLIPYKQASRSYFPQDWTIFLSFKADSFSQVGYQ